MLLIRLWQEISPALKLLKTYLQTFLKMLNFYDISAPNSPNFLMSPILQSSTIESITLHFSKLFNIYVTNLLTICFM